jgi:ribonuclease III
VYPRILMTSLGHHFADAKLLELALTHASVDRKANNERLEFLGDAVLDLLVAEELFVGNTDLSEGEMTERKSALVSRRTLAAAATELGLPHQARLGRGLDAGSLSRSVLANLYEGVVGAIYIDAGLEAARKFVLATLGERLDDQLEGTTTIVPKQRLQELCQREWGEPPTYEMVESRGLAHARAFCVRAIVNDKPHATAWGRTLKEAESWAAQEALLVLEPENGA